MNIIALNNVSVLMTSQDIANLLYDEGILIASNIVDFLNNSYSKSVLIEINCWQDTEEAYHIIKNLKHKGETEIETSGGIFIAKALNQEEIADKDQVEIEIGELEQELKPNSLCEELDAYLEQMSVEDECIWMREYEKVSSVDEINRDESYLYLDLRKFIRLECV